MKLLLAVDVGGLETHELVDQAAEWAARTGGRLDLLHVAGPSEAFAFVHDAEVRAAVDREVEAMERRDQRLLDALLLRVPEAHRGVARVVAGPTMESILAAAADYDAVLVGTHGRSGLQRLWLGSVAEEVVRRCERPVLVLRQRGPR